MKRGLFILLFIVHIISQGNAQISDQQAREKFQQAEEMFEAGNFYRCNEICEELIDKMGKANPKTLYLSLKSVYNNLENKNDKSEYNYKKNYRNFIHLSKYAEQFFSLADKNTYPADKYKEITDIHEYIKQGIKKYEYQRDRKPEDAIRFLNDCAKKFEKKSAPEYAALGKGNCSVDFSLKDSILVINALATFEDYKSKKYNQAGRERIEINLSKTWIKRFRFKHHKGGGDYRFFFYQEFGNTTMHDYYEKQDRSNFWDVDTSAPVIIGPTVFVNGKAKYDHINWYWDHKYDKNMEYSLAEFDKKIKSDGFIKISSGFYIYNFFEQFWNDEYKAGNYRSRIKDAFEYLIEYFGGGTPVETPTDNKSSDDKF